VGSIKLGNGETWFIRHKKPDFRHPILRRILGFEHVEGFQLASQGRLKINCILTCQGGFDEKGLDLFCTYFSNSWTKFEMAFGRNNKENLIFLESEQTWEWGVMFYHLRPFEEIV